MDYLIMAAFLAALGSLAAANAVIAVVIWRSLRGNMSAAPRQDPAPETEEEAQLRQLAAEAQKHYEQGFVNLMRYDGRPCKRKDGGL